MKRVTERFWDFPSALLLTLILLTVSQRLLTTDWAAHLVIALILSGLGCLLGLVLGVSRLGRLGVFLLAIGYSLPVILLVNGWILYPDIPWLERMLNIGVRLWISLTLFLSTQPVPDTLLFVFAVSLGFWIISLLAGYTLTRDGNFTTAVLPAGAVLVLIHLADSGINDKAWVLAIYIFLCLLLLGRILYARKRQFWKVQHVLVPAESHTYFNQLFIVAALVLVLLAWSAPTSPRAFDKLWEAWERLTHKTQLNTDLQNLIAGLDDQQSSATGFYGPTLPLGRQAASGVATYLRVHAPELQETEYYYWRVRTYELFQDNQWSSDYGITAPFTSNRRPLLLEDTVGRSGEFIFTVMHTRLSVLVTPNHPLWTSYPAFLTYSPSVQGRVDPLMFRADPVVEIGKSYIIRANIYNPTVLELRPAGEEYPSWVTAHYLQLPEDIAPEIGALAEQITARAQTPYDKAVAITEYLRTNITYSLTAAYPETETDLLKWFLFESKTGFCNYYASAEVILLRSVGIPSRIVVGFAQGEFESPNAYTIRQQDEHAWPEAYFPGIGWVEFEPTVSQPRILRLPGEQLANHQITPTPEKTEMVGPDLQTPLRLEDGGAGSGSGGPPNSFLNITLSLLAFLVMILGGFVAYAFGLFDNLGHTYPRVFKKPVPILLRNVYTYLDLLPPGWLVRWAYFIEQTPMQRSFSIVYQSLHWIGEKTLPAQTPAQAAAALILNLPQVSEEIGVLLQEYQKTIYSPSPGEISTASRSIKIIRSHALRLATQRRWQTLKRPFERIFTRKIEVWTDPPSQDNPRNQA